jgi:uncharacterized protein YjbI with pentapeptide repeats
MLVWHDLDIKSVLLCQLSYEVFYLMLDMIGADLRYANLRDADLRGMKQQQQGK